MFEYTSTNSYGYGSDTLVWKNKEIEKIIASDPVLTNKITELIDWAINQCEVYGGIRWVTATCEDNKIGFQLNAAYTEQIYIGESIEEEGEDEEDYSIQSEFRPLFEDIEDETDTIDELDEEFIIEYKHKGISSYKAFL